MSQQHAPATLQQQTKLPTTPATPSAPVPIDPNLLRQISGGQTATGPNPGW